VSIIHFSSIQLLFINVPSQQPDGQLQEEHYKSVCCFYIRWIL